MKPIWTNIRVKLGQIRAWTDNPRMSTKAQAERIIKAAMPKDEAKRVWNGTPE